MARKRKPKRSKEQGRISRINLGTGWHPYDGDPVARDMSERRRKTTAPLITKIRPKQYQEMLSWIDVLERLIIELPKQPPSIGHNRPPISEKDVQSINKCIIILKHEPTPDDARAAGSILMMIGERLGAYLVKQTDIFVSEAVKSAGKEFGKRLVQSPFWWALATTLMILAQSVQAWLR